MPPPTAEPIEVVSTSLDVLKLRCGQYVSDENTPIEKWEKVTDVYPKAQPGQSTEDRKRTVKFTQHCEITLALNILARHTQATLTKRKIEIGVSKACCEWCCEYLNFLAFKYPKYPILVRASHGKQPDGWLMPPNGPKSVTKQMVQSIEGRVDDVIGKIKRRRRSDSNELSLSTREGADPETDREAVFMYGFDFEMSDS